jgi:hypothetical protein
MLGLGTQASPFIVSTPQDLNNIRNKLTSYYELSNDIDMSSFGKWSIILHFHGQIDGKGYAIKNLTMNGQADLEIYACAFVSNIESASSFTIKNLGFEDIYFITNVSGYRSGGITNHSYNATIENCYVTGEVITQTDFGGIGALIRGSSKVKNCWTNVKVTSSGTSLIAGICSQVVDNFPIENCYSIGQLNSSNKYGISSSVSTNATNNFWNTETTGTNQSGMGIGKTTNEMKVQSTYTGWDFTSVWGISGDYPFLQVFGSPAPLPKILTISVTSYGLDVLSNVNKSIKATMNTQSILSPINAYLQRKTRVERNTLTYTLPIDTSVIKTTRSVRNSLESVTTYINPISSFIERRTKTFKNLIGYISPIQADISVLYPLNVFVPFAHLSIRDNPTITYSNENQSIATYIINPSLGEVIE